MKTKMFCLKNMSLVRKFRILISSIFVMCFFTACAMGVDRVKLYEPLTYKPEKEEAVKSAHAAVPQEKKLNSKNIKLAMNKVKDNRQDISCIGAKKNAYGMKMGKVDVEEGVVFIDLFKKNLINAFELAGYEIVPVKSSATNFADNKEDAKALVDAEVRTFWVEFMPGLFVVDAESDVIFEVRFIDRETNREIWSETFRGKGKVSGIAVTRSMFEESINLAYADAMKKFYGAISDDKVRNLFTK